MRHAYVKETLSILLAVCLMFTLLAGCGQQKAASSEAVTNSAAESNAAPSEDNSEGEKVKLTFITWAEEERIAAQKELNAAFTEKYPNIEVAVEKPAKYWDKLYTMNAAGTPPDIFFEQEMRPPTEIAEGLCEPLDAYIEKDPSFNREAFFPALFAPFTVDGELYVIPSVTYSSVLFYNKDLFDAAGLDYPDDTWTWDDYVETAKKLTIDTDGDGRIDQYGCTVDKLVNFYLPWVFSNGGDLLAEDRKTFLMNSPEGTEAVQFLRDLIYTHKVAPEPNTNVDAIASAFTFQTGKVGMEVMGSWMTPTYDKSDFDYGITMIPKSPHTNERLPMFYIGAYAMAAKGQHKDEAWKYISYAASEEGQSMIAECGLGMPTIISVAESDTFLNSSPKADMQVVLDSLKMSKGVITCAKWGEIDKIIKNLGDEIFLNMRDTQSVLDDMKTQVEAVTATLD